MLGVSVPGDAFVGRAAEAAALRAAWESVRQGSARVVGIEGAPGMGKRMLIDQLLSKVTAPVVRVSGVEAESTMPWGILREPRQGCPAEASATWP